MSVRAGYTRFITVWLIYSFLNGFIVYRALESPMKSSTPRLVYWWYQKAYDVSYFFGMIAYFIMLGTFFHFTMMFGYSEKEEANLFIVNLFYGSRADY